MIHYLHKFVFSFSVFLGLLFAITRFATGTALDDYVAAPDKNYSYSLINTVNEFWSTGYILEMTSQKWRTSVEVDRPLWRHWLTIVVPDTVKHNTCMLIIGGGDNNPVPPDSVDWSLVLTAITAETVVAYLEMIPNQPLYFQDETQSRSEDAIIAYSWDKYLTTGDETWPVQLPMAKSVIRAMDTVEAFCATPGGGQITINDFMVGGTSKRGWTTWLTAAVDSRVSAIVPIVFDALNMERSFNHHHAAYGYWSSAVCDYEDMGIFEWIGTPEIRSLMDIVDPYAYRHRYTMPKYIINSTGDEFFLPDSSQFYFDDLPGEKYMRYVPNTGHSMGMEIYDVIFSLVSFYQAILNDSPLPRFSWTLETDDSIRVETLDAPNQVNLWQATNPTDRDFRYSTIGSAWTSSILTDQGGGVYIGQVPEPETGWTAFFVELTYNNGLLPYKFTTVVNVIPDFLPFDKSGLVADFGTSGLYHYDGQVGWDNISTGNAECLENYNGDLAAGFSGFGLYLYDGTWTRISTGDTEDMIAIGADLCVDFGTSGLYKYSDGAWTKISTGNPEGLETYNDKLVADFDGFGLYEWDGAWAKISTGNAEDMIGLGTDLYVDFANYGLYKYSGGIWTKISTGNPEGLGTYDKKLVADFDGFGLYEWDGAWAKISTGNAEDMIGVGSDLYVDFGILGLYKYSDGIWTRISTGNAEDLGAYDAKLAADFGVSGLYEWDSAWTRISTDNSEDMVDVNSND